MASISLARTKAGNGKKELTAKEAKFVAEYAKTLNAYEATRRAYPTCKNVDWWTYQLKVKPHIKEKLDQIRQAIIDEANPAAIVKEYQFNIDTYRDPVDLNRASHSLKALNGLANYTKEAQQTTQVNVGINLQIP